MNNLFKSLTIALLTNSVEARTKWNIDSPITRTYKDSADKEMATFNMRFYSYVDEEQADLGAIFAPTIEVKFAEEYAPKDTDVVRLCLSYRLTKDATDSTVVEAVCFIT